MIRALFPATFDPIHYGHINIALRASKLFDHLIVAVYELPQKSLFFPTDQRVKLVKEALKSEKKIEVTTYHELTIDYCRSVNAQVIVRGLRVFSDFEYEFRMALANSVMAPDIETVALITSKEHSFISSTTVREVATLNGDVSSMVPKYVEKALKDRIQELQDNGEEAYPAAPFRD
jgi:pantetheine-phosphate adenylyltransferase